jgi:hypothetical protein
MGVDLESRKGLYENSIIQKVVNGMWFANKNDEGVVYHEYFKPFPLITTALICTAVDTSTSGRGL